LTSDLLYLHSDFASDTYGAVIVSTYSLFGANQLWSYPFQGDGNPEYFQNETAEGVFNATLALLGDYYDMDDYSAPFDPDRGPPGMWVSVVGHNGIWPLAFLAPERLAKLKILDLSESMVDADSDSHREASRTGGLPPEAVDLAPIFVPRAFSIFFGLLTLGCGLFAVALLSVSLKIPGIERLVPDWFSKRFGEAAFEEFRDQQRLNAAAFGVYLTLMYLAFAGIAAIPAFCFPIAGTILNRPLPWYASVLAAGSLAVLILLVIGTISRLVARDNVTRYDERGLSVGLSITWLLLLALTLGFLLRVACRGETSALLLFLRGASLRSGVSPLAPILYVTTAALILTWCSLGRLSWAQRRHVTPPPQTTLCREDGTAIRALFLDLEDHSFEGISALECRIAHLVSDSFFSLDRSHRTRSHRTRSHWTRSYWILPLIAAGVFALDMLILNPIRRSFDGPLFILLFVVASAVTYFGLAASLVRMLAMWWATKRLLRRLYWHPSRNAYENFRAAGILPGVGSESETRRAVGFDLWDTHSSWANIEFGIETSKRLLAEWEPDLGEPGEQAQFDDLKKDVEAAQTSLRNAETNDAGEEPGLAIEQRFQAQSVLSRIVRRVSLLAASIWQPDGTPLPRIRQDVLRKEAELMVANRVLDLIHHVFPQLMNLATTATVGLILMLLAISSYDFPNERFLLWYSWGSVFSAVIVLLYVFAAINRDRILSLLTGTTPGSLNFNAGFLLQVLIYGAVPILALLGVQFPGRMGQLFAWVSRIGASHPS